MSDIPQNVRICFVVNQFREPVTVIATLIFEGETEKDVQRKLEKTLEKLPFRTLFSYVTSNSVTTFHEIFKDISITEIIDSPGLETVRISLNVECETKYFLPRNLQNGEFVDIEKQVKCLEALKLLPKYPQYR